MRQFCSALAWLSVVPNNHPGVHVLICMAMRECTEVTGKSGCSWLQARDMGGDRLERCDMQDQADLPRGHANAREAG